jgi:lipopolysaccharide export system permease protein
MRTVRRLLYVDIASSVLFVALAFLSLFFFVDFADELGDLVKGYTALHAAIYSLLLLPGRLYELTPIAVLIGTIYALSRMAQSSEFTILRTGGLGPQRALSLLAVLGVAFAVITFVIGDYVAPHGERMAATLRANARGASFSVGGSGAWLKDHGSTPQGERSYSINVGGADVDGQLRRIRIFEFDADGRLVQRIGAAGARIGADRAWTLSDVVRTVWNATAPDGSARIAEEKLDRFVWQSTLAAGVVAAAVLPENSMSTIELFRYIDHLSDNEQAAQRYEIRFWKRALYPFACLVMVALALPFAYLHARAGGVSLKVFGGIMLGISFVLLNNVAGHLGLLHNWTPWIVASVPSLFYLLLSLAAFSWLVRYR